jgi:hypothetical protein
MMLPWRRAPFPIPKDRKGNDLYERPLSPPPSPPQLASKSKKSQRMMGSTDPSLSQSMKKETPKVKSGKPLPSPALLGSTFATNIKGGEFAATPTPRIITTESPISPETPSSQKNKIRSTSNSARAAGIRYPIFQPNFSPPEPPPPPPPPKNKYKVTLGIKPRVNNKSTKKSSKALPPPHLSKRDCHSPQNDILRVQVFDDHLDEELSPYLLSTNPPSSSRDKRNIIENNSKNRPTIVQSKRGGVTVRLVFHFSFNLIDL